jgi:hypothetical protein
MWISFTGKLHKNPLSTDLDPVSLRVGSGSILNEYLWIKNKGTVLRRWTHLFTPAMVMT